MINRLILIGNGFDLAHGLKTSYKDFILWYLAESIVNVSYNNLIYEDGLLEIKIHNLDLFIQYLLKDKNIPFKVSFSKEDVDDFLNRIVKEGNLSNFLNLHDNYIMEPIIVGQQDRFRNLVEKSTSHYTIFVKSNLLRKLIFNFHEFNWVDIEQEYFDQLKSCRDLDNRFDYNKVNTLNRDLAYLKAKLEEYLSLQDAQFDNRQNFQLSKLLAQDFEENDFDPNISNDELRTKLGKDFTDDKSKNIQHKLYVLNFNYTNTFFNYIREIKGNYFSHIEVNHIHGQLNNPNNPIIFGFGDEHDKEYLFFEEHNNNALFEHVKSYYYMKTPNYRNLIRFLNEDYYQVLVVGHSCGLSDRTMFKEIFDHENCKSVKILHHKGIDGRTDFFDKTINLGRHFTDKGRMRRLIVNFNEADVIPQFEK